MNRFIPKWGYKFLLILLAKGINSQEINCLLLKATVLVKLLEEISSQKPFTFALIHISPTLKEGFNSDEVLQKLSENSIPYLNFQTWKPNIGLNFQATFLRSRPIFGVKTDPGMAPITLGALQGLIEPLSLNKGKFIFWSENPHIQSILSDEEYGKIQRKLEIKCGRGNPLKSVVTTVCHHCPAKHILIRSYGFFGGVSSLRNLAILKYQSNLFLELGRNFYGKSFKLISAYGVGSKKVLRGYATMLRMPNNVELVLDPPLRMIASWARNSNLTINDLEVSELGFTKINGTFKGFVGGVNGRESSVGIGYAPVHFLNREMETTRPYLRNRIAMLLRTGRKEVSGFDILAIINSSVQLAVLGLGAFLAILMLAVAILRNRLKTTSQGRFTYDSVLTHRNFIFATYGAETPRSGFNSNTPSALFLVDLQPLYHLQSSGYSDFKICCSGY
ncbi:unnamed protein product [Allacma fusca]|uniref:Uncharacterized protein n=1 Tax=Allacma fusca TaxID=39272 RepID=A0A8J2Q2D2_9HEXA|nr:unnamed protein product [Allacma fusca]